MIRPEIGLSDIYLNISVETGTSFQGVFTIYSKNGQELLGKVISTNDKVVATVTEISGTKCEIPFYFKGKMAIPGEEHYGEFLLLTNGGEKNIPYCITVIPRKLWYGDRFLSSLDDFSKLAGEDWNKAREIFFIKDFPEILLAEQEELRSLYHDLLKGRSKDMIMEQFLMAAIGKPPVKVSVDVKEVRIDETKVGRFLMKKEGWGCLEGRIYGEADGLYVNMERFYQDSFEEDQAEIFLSLKEGFEKDVLIIETAFSRFRIPVMRKTVYETVETSKTAPDKVYSALLRHYIDFRTDRISVKEYVEESMKHFPVKGRFYELYCLLLLLIRKQTADSQESEDKEAYTEYEEYAGKIEEQSDIYRQDPLCRNFYYYVSSLWKRDPKYTKEAAAQIRASFEKEGKFEDYLLLTLMDEKTAFHYREQWSILTGYLEQGDNSPLLYLALLDVLNQEPYFLEQLDEKKTAVIGWGIRHQYVSRRLMEQYAHLSMREKNYRSNQLPILMGFYGKLSEDLYLKAVCAMLMRGNRTEKEYHVYFEEAVRRKINLIGLNEFYLRTLDFDTYPLLPQTILYYFQYSNSLDKREKAWLYLNILMHQKEYDDIYYNYKDRIEEFVKEQLIESRMNRHLKRLYELLLPSILQEKDMAKYVPNILFRKKICCHNPVIEGIYVCHQVNEDEVYIRFVDGICQAEIYSDTVQYYLVDRMGNRYCAGVAFEIEDYLDEEMYKEYCLNYIRDNRKVYTKWIYLEEDDKKEQLARLLVQNDETKSWKREKAVERILDYHYEEKTLEDLSECLDQINYRVISPSYRRTLMHYYMACNRMEDAYFGVELYGSDLMEPVQLYLLTCVGLYLHKEEKDDLLLIMCHRTFMNRRYNKEILLYLRTYFEGRIFDYLDIWKILKQEGLDTAEYEERVLKQILFVGKKRDEIFPVLQSYMEKTKSSELVKDILAIYSTSHVTGCLNQNGKKVKTLPDSYFAILEKEVKKGGNLSFMAGLSYLFRKAAQGYTKEDAGYIRNLLRPMYQKQIVFSQFVPFEPVIAIPSLFKESCCCWFFAEEKKEYAVTLVLSNKGKERKEEVPVKELAPGFYQGLFYVPCFEKIKEGYYWSPDSRGEIDVKPIFGCVEGSRNQLLDRIQEEKDNSASWMNEYGKIMERIDSQLTYLGE